MTGTIRSGDVLCHLWLIGHRFGLRALGRCLVAVVTHRQTTFLEMVGR